MRRTGTVNLPLHGGRAPRWLFQRMVELSGAITEVILEDYGNQEFLRRISDPYWFQAFGCVLSFDWHSSGLTTTVCGALKESLKPEEHGILVAGGKGKTSRRTPSEIADNPFNLSGKTVCELQRASRLSAKVDNSCVQDNYQLYHHVFFLAEEGDWAVVQQGMNPLDSYARRYHWLSEGIASFVEEPHAAICCDRTEKRVLDVTAKTSWETRKGSLDLVKDNPEHLRKYTGQKSLAEFTMPRHHPVLSVDLSERDFQILHNAYELQPGSYEELLLFRGMGPKKIRALALISDLVYGSRASWKDPVKYSFAHGGKDGYPYPVDKESYDHSIEVLQEAIDKATLDSKERHFALVRLRDFL
jgi:hypothetical protein